MRKELIFFLVLLIGVAEYNLLWAYDGEVHMKIDEYAAKPEVSQLDSVLKNLGIELGIETKLEGNDAEGKEINQKIWEWICYGGDAEDYGFKGKGDFWTTRAFNHFHDPLKDWNDAGFDKFGFNQLYHYHYGRSPVSSILWGLDPDRQNFAQNITGDWSWGKAREYYYIYLTGKDFEANEIAIGDDERKENFAYCFRALGQAMHLLQDASVPLHTRNDLHVFPIDKLPDWVPDWGQLKVLRRWTFETYTKKNIEHLDYTPDQAGDCPDPHLLQVSAIIPDPNYPDMLPVSGLFDRNAYNDPGPIPPGNILGLAEYSNANFLTLDTMWDYPHPNIDNDTNYLSIDWMHPETVVAENGKSYNRLYIKFKEGVGEDIAHLAAVDYYTKEYLSNVHMVVRGGFTLDEVCWKDYASKLIPRAVGYSAALLDYFFRGTIEISLPEKGVYAFTDLDPTTIDPTTQGFDHITLRAQNTSPEGEEMTNGSIELVVKYRLALADPFISYYPNFAPYTEEFSYIVVPEASGTRSIPRESPGELNFDLSGNPIPLWATDLYLQVVYKGRLGDEDDAVGVGFKDISEPTPIDFFNSMDKVCLYEHWYDAGSQKAIELVDADNNGIADPDEWDVYPDDMEDIYVRFSPVTTCQYPTETEYNLYIPYLSAGEYIRVFLLSDYEFCMGNSTISVVHTHPDDHFGYTWFTPALYSITGIKHQTELELRYGPLITTFRGVEHWISWIFLHGPFPEDSSCSLDELE